ncbi:uncharacterized protein ACNS7B_020475 [Menidia menidia]
MSVEDLSSDFQSEESGEEEGGDSDGGEGAEPSYVDLLLLHNNLKFFHHIYTNNAIMDLEEQMEAGADGELESDSQTLFQGFLEGMFEELSSSEESPASLGRTQEEEEEEEEEEELSSDSEGSGELPASLQGLIDLLEEVASSSPSSSSTDSG